MKTKRHRTIHSTSRAADRALLESGRAFRALMNTTPYAILISDRRGRFLEANPAACRQLGYTRPELLRKDLFDIVGRDYLPRARMRLNSMRAERGFMESVHRRRDGSEFPVEVSVRRITYEGGPALLGIVKDISAEKRALSELREREARFMAMVDNAPIFIFLLDKERIVYANRLTLGTLGGRRRPGLLGLNVTAIFPPEQRKVIKERIRLRLSGRQDMPLMQLKVLGLDGRAHDMAMQSLLVRHGEEKRIAVFGVNIGELKDTEARLRESESLYRMLAESIPDYIYLLDRHGRVLYRNRYLSQFGSDPLGKLQHEIFPPAAAKKHLEVIKRVLSTGKISNRVEHIEKHGAFSDQVYMENRLMPLLSGDGSRDCLLGITRDITHRTLTEEALKRSNSELALFNEMDSILLRCHGNDMYGAMADLFIRAFPADGGAFGYIDENTGDYVAPCLSPAAMRRRGIRKFPVRFLPGSRGAAFFAAAPDTRVAVRAKARTSGSGAREAASVVVFFDSRPLGFITLERMRAGFSDQDLHRLERLAQHLAPILGARLEQQRQEAENQRMMSEFISAQRIESLGVIAGGIAHDFNNMLSGIMGNLSLLNMELPAGEKGWREMTSEAIDATENARLLAKQLITFSKGGGDVRKRVDLGGLARRAALFATRGSNCSPRFELPRDLWPVSGDETQLTQAVHNLVLNSVQSMPGGGEIVLTAANEPHSPRPDRPAAKNRYVSLRIRDTGFGIAHTDRKRIFEPFFSTKSAGRGLGLPMSQTIITRHGGRIELDSSAGKGSCFTIRLPAASGHRKAEVSACGSQTLKKGSGRILVMEDDVILSASLCRMLRALGYAPLEVSNGEKALEAYAEAERAGIPFRAVIMDLMIPGGMGGEEAVKRLKAAYPGARVILSSGYTEAPAASDHSAHGFDGMIQKPYGIEALAGALAAVLS